MCKLKLNPGDVSLHHSDMLIYVLIGYLHLNKTTCYEQADDDKCCIEHIHSVDDVLLGACGFISLLLSHLWLSLGVFLLFAYYTAVVVEVFELDAMLLKKLVYLLTCRDGVLPILKNDGTLT